MRPATAVELQIGGMGCAACATQIEQALRPLPGLAAVRVDASTGRARVELADGAGEGPLQEAVLRAIRRLGYSANPAGSAAAAGERLRSRRAALKRLVVAGFGMMQVMMIAFALYAADEFRIDPAILDFLRYTSLLITLPVVLYSARPMFQAALAQLAARRPAMDTPVALGILAALVASIWNTFAGAGEVYYDAVTMFIFFLATARYIEMTTRHEVGSVTEALAWLLPPTVLREEATRIVAVSPASLGAGDVIVVNQGDLVAADGVILSGSSSFNEACLSGESAPVARGAGDPVASGSVNLGVPVRVRVTAAGESTELAAVLRLLERSRGARPALLGVTDRVAQWFSLAVLAIAAAVSVIWLIVDPAMALPSTVAVLVVACPCALALAAPSVAAVANSALARSGLLAVSATALERLAKVDYALLDKTGTLTVGRPQVEAEAVRPGVPVRQALAIAAALERGSSHPLAAAFRAHESPDLLAVDIVETPGEGMTGRVDGCDYRLGRPDAAGDADGIVLADGNGIVAHFDVRDAIRPDVAAVIGQLHGSGIGTGIASGDGRRAVDQVAAALGIRDRRARLTPAGKIARLDELRAAGHRVLVVGDGVNDAPVLAAADVSIVLRSGSALAQTAGDLLLLDEAWQGIPAAIAIARRAGHILRQNLAWAAAYNLTAIPAAALGLLPPWLAALGMSLSSLLVVANARRVAA
ncbi:MAG: cadmium-translocating P-type ATPase [Gammaproteobacteria bacterium]|nr:cadmium-translocating P-type ATPase [Gammaproteobacteria bacterium]